MSVAWNPAGTPGDSPPSPAQVWEGLPGTAQGPGLSGPLRGLGLQGRVLLR